MKIWQLIIIFLLCIGAISLISSIDIPGIDEPIIDDIPSKDDPDTSTDDDIDVEKIEFSDYEIIF